MFNNNTNNTVVTMNPEFAAVYANWYAWRADRIVALMMDGHTYKSAVKWSRRHAKQEGEWHVGA